MTYGTTSVSIADRSRLGRSLAWSGLCYLLLAFWVCRPFWGLASTLGGGVGRIWNEPGAGAVILFAGPFTAVVVVVAAVLTAALVAPSVIHWRLGKGLSAGRERAATAACGRCGRVGVAGRRERGSEIAREYAP